PGDDQGRDPRRRGEHPRAGHRPGGRPGDPTHPRPPVRLRGLPGAVEEGHAAALGGPRPVGGHPRDRRAGARADGVRRRRLLGHHRRPGHRGRGGGGCVPARGPAADGRRVAQGGDVGQVGRLKATGAAKDSVVLDETAARALAGALEGADFTVDSVESKPYTRRPYAPFMTSTLQQEAGRKLRYTSERTMRIAQRLYENGYITYMRTDSTSLSQGGIAAARAQATELYGS